MRKGRTPAGFVPKPLRNRSRKNAETSLKPPGQTQEKGVCPSHCETVAGKMPKRCWNPLERRKYMPKPCETAARNSAQTMRNRSQKTAETLLLEPTKNKTSSKANLCATKLGSLQATRPNSRKRCLGRACEKAEPQQVLCPSHCETVAGKMPKRRCWNPLKRKKYMPKPCETAARKLPKRCFWTLLKTMRNRSQKTAETLLLEPTKCEKAEPQ